VDREKKQSNQKPDDHKPIFSVHEEKKKQVQKLFNLYAVASSKNAKTTS